MNAYVTCRQCGHRDAVDSENPPPWCRKCGADRKKSRAADDIHYAVAIPPVGSVVDSEAMVAGPPRLPWEVKPSPPPVPRPFLSECIAERPLQIPPPSPPPFESRSEDVIPEVAPVEEDAPDVNIAIQNRIEFFDAVMVSSWGWKRKYRVFLTREDMLLIELLLPNYVNDRMAALGAFFLFGGGLLGWWLASNLHDSTSSSYSQKVHLDLLSQADIFTLRGLAARNRNNLRVIRDDVYEMSLETPSSFHRIAWLNFHCAAVLKMRHCLWGNVTLQVETQSGLMLILRELPHLFGDRLDVHVDGYRSKRHAVPPPLRN